MIIICVILVLCAFWTVDIPLYIRLLVYDNVCIVMYVLNEQEETVCMLDSDNDRGNPDKNNTGNTRKEMTV